MEGHRVIEAVAYRRILAGDGGKPMLAALIRANLLEKPDCFKEDDGWCWFRKRDDALARWPTLGSHRPDMVIARQFSGAGQCYHFMARKEDEEGHDGAVSPALRGAYFRCADMLRRLAAEVVLTPSAEGDNARESNRSLYELMHAVADSFSTAHTSRGLDGRIEYLKVWDPATWSNPLRIFDREPASPATRHRTGESRDDDYLEGQFQNSPCKDHLSNPYQMPWGCLSAQGQKAVLATEALLRTIHTLRSRHAGKKTTSVQAVEDDMKEWDDFMATHVPRPIQAGPWTSMDEYSVSNLYALKTSMFWPKNHSMSLSYTRFARAGGAVPLLPSYHYELGVTATDLGQRAEELASHANRRNIHFFFETSLGLQIPLGSHLMFGLTPLYTRIYLEKPLFQANARTDTLPYLDVGVRLFRLYGFLPRFNPLKLSGVWAGIEGPYEWSPLHGRDAWGVNLSVGIWTDKQRPQISVTDPLDEPATPPADDWVLPPVSKAKTKHAYPSYWLGLELTSFDESSRRGEKSPSLFGFSFQRVNDTYTDGSDPRLMMGATLSLLLRNQLIIRADGAPVNQQRFVTMAFSPLFKLWALDVEVGKLGFMLEPTRLESGLVTTNIDGEGNSTDASPNWKNLFFQAGSRLGLFLLTRPIQFEISGPQWLVYSEGPHLFKRSGESVTFRMSILW